MYNKLFSKIVTSSVWLSPTDHRIVWITFIALMDQDGYVPIASAANLAHTARVPLEAAQAAIKAFESPDPHDPEQEFEGRRIERVANGWLVLNAKKYQQMATGDKIREQTRIRNQAYRARKNDAKMTQRDAPVTQETQNDANDENVTTSGSVSGSVSNQKNTIDSESLVSDSKSESLETITSRVCGSSLTLDQDHHAEWLKVKADYPVGTYRQSEFLEAEREAIWCVTEGLCTWAAWGVATKAYSRQREALDSSGRYTLSPRKFFHRDSRSWIETFPIPESQDKAEVAKTARLLAETLEFEKLKARAALTGFRAPFPIESPQSYETAIRMHERDHEPGRPNGRLR